MTPTTAPQRPPLTRPAGDRVVAGVASGAARHLGVNVHVVRLGFVLLTLLGGTGVPAYGFLWATVPASPEVPGEETRRRYPAWLGLLGAGFLLLVLGIKGEFHLFGVRLSVSLVMPLGLLLLGVLVVWGRLDDQTRARLAPDGDRHPRRALLGLVGGIGLCGIGAIWFVALRRPVGDVITIVLAALVVLGGVGLLLAPWGMRLWNDLRAEQAARVRETERADIAAHLHDSVLQTLALIQRRAEDPTGVARLARAQERELRAYLYGAAPTAEETLAAACRAMIDDVEDAHGVPVELVVTGDRPSDPDTTALVQALREAVLNAVRHGAPPVTAFVEVGPREVEAFVRDHGPGFDLTDIPEDRLGVRGSVIGRMERHGGTATVRRRSPGTEVQLCLPLRDRAAQAEPGTPASAFQAHGSTRVNRPATDHPTDPGAPA